MKCNLPWPLSGYQRRWLKLLDSSLRRVAILAARGSAKTWTVALWCFLRLFKRKAQITIVPGGKQTQGSQLMKYIEELVIWNASARRAVLNWSATRIRLMNGSELRIVAPTKNGVQGGRGDIIVEEAQRLPPEVGQLMEPIASRKGNRIILIGTPEYPSWFFDRWMSMEGSAKDIVMWEEAVEAGILSREAVEDYRRNNPSEMFRSQYCCEWVRKDDYAFFLEPAEGGRIDKDVTGVDFNGVAKHHWVEVQKVTRDNQSFYLVVDWGQFDKTEDIRKLPGRLLVCEDNGYNEGFFETAERLDERVVGHPWRHREKEENIQVAKLCNEMGVLKAPQEFCNIINDLKFVNGKLEHTEYGAAWLHAIHGLENYNV